MHPVVHPSVCICIVLQALVEVSGASLDDVHTFWMIIPQHTKKNKERHTSGTSPVNPPPLDISRLLVSRSLASLQTLVLQGRRLRA